jgi:hypothetical protein
MPSFMKVHVHWMSLIKNQIIQKFQSFESLNVRDAKQKDSFFKPFDKKCLMSSKCLALDVGHM